MRKLPQSTLVDVSPGLARQLHVTAMALPSTNDTELRDPEYQRMLLAEFRRNCLEGFDQLAATIKTGLALPPYCVVVRGLISDEAKHQFFVLCSTLGKPWDPYDTSWSRLIQRIECTNAVTEDLHTDSTGWPEPNDHTCLLFARPDQRGGGKSLIMDIPTLLNELVGHFGGAIIDLLEREPIPWRIEDEFGGGVRWVPILDHGNLRWMRHTIHRAMEYLRIDHLDQQATHCVDAVTEITTRSSNVFCHAMGHNEILFLNNKRLLHARTPIISPEKSHRLLWRIKVRSMELITDEA